MENCNLLEKVSIFPWKIRKVFSCEPNFHKTMKNKLKVIWECLSLGKKIQNIQIWLHLHKTIIFAWIFIWFTLKTPNFSRKVAWNLWQTTDWTINFIDFPLNVQVKGRKCKKPRCPSTGNWFADSSGINSVQMVRVLGGFL